MALSRFHTEFIFTNLLADGGKEKSPPTPDRDYNCVAFAADDMERIWWPGLFETYWPIDEEDETLENFEKAFGTLGYQRCGDDSLEPGYEKVAFYADNEGPQHAAKQLPDGRWKSKLGSDLDDVEHNTVRGAECRLYGKAVLFMKREISK
jgi:hypothetical protein